MPELTRSRLCFLRCLLFNSSRPSRIRATAFVTEVGPSTRTNEIRCDASVGTPMQVGELSAVSSRSEPRFREVCVEAISLRASGRCNRGSESDQPTGLLRAHLRQGRRSAELSLTRLRLVLSGHGASAFWQYRRCPKRLQRRTNAPSKNSPATVSPHAGPSPCVYLAPKPISSSKSDLTTPRRNQVD